MPRSHVMVRLIRPEEIEAASRLLDDSGRFFPHNVLKLPLTRLMVAEKWEGDKLRPVMYQPIYPSLFLGSYVRAEGATEGELAQALLATTREAYSKAHEWGMADLMISTNTPETSGFAERNGWEYTHPTYRMEVR